MSNLLERLNSGEVLVGDGAMGTMLFQKGLKIGECPEEINLNSPEILEEVARSYLEAGADVIQTNTFGGSPPKLAQYSLENKTEEINIGAVRSVRRAIGKKAFLAVSCGPSGQLLKPYGEADPEDILNGFKRQLSAVIPEGIDLICIETMTDLTEALLAVNAAKSLSSTVPVAATMTFDSTPNGFYTIMGVSVERAVGELIEAGVDIVGSNCGNGIDNMIQIAFEFRKYTVQPLLIQSNAGLPEVKGDSLVYPETPRYMAEKCRKLLDGGVNIIGGCCGTTPEHIAAIRKVVDEFNGKRRAS